MTTPDYFAAFEAELANLLATFPSEPTATARRAADEARAAIRNCKDALRIISWEAERLEKLAASRLAAADRAKAEKAKAEHERELGRIRHQLEADENAAALRARAHELGLAGKTLTKTNTKANQK